MHFLRYSASLLLLTSVKCIDEASSSLNSDVSFMQSNRQQASINLLDKPGRIPHPQHHEKNLQDGFKYSETGQLLNRHGESFYPGMSTYDNRNSIHLESNGVIKLDTRPSENTPQIHSSVSDFQSLYEESLQSKLETPIQRFVPRWSPGALPLSDVHLTPHSNSELDQAGFFLYKKPSLQGDIWNSIYQDYSPTESAIRIKNDLDGLLLERKLTDYIKSIATQIEESFILMQTKPQPTQSYMTPSSDFEFGLTRDELAGYRFIKDFQPFTFDPYFKYTNVRFKAEKLFLSANLGSDIVMLSKHILKFPKICDQNQLGRQISDRLASLAYIDKLSAEFYSSLDTISRRRDINEFCRNQPTLANIVPNINRGIQILSVLLAVKNPKIHIQDSIRRMEKKMQTLRVFQERMSPQIYHDSLPTSSKHFGRDFKTSSPDHQIMSSPDQSSFTKSNDKDSIELLKLQLSLPESEESHKSVISSPTSDEESLLDSESSPISRSNNAISNSNYTISHPNIDSTLPHELNKKDTGSLKEENLNDISTGQTPLFDNALTLLKITKKSSNTKPSHIIKLAVARIESAIETTLNHDQPQAPLSEDSRKELLLLHHPSLISCLTSEELTGYVGIFRVKRELIQELNKLDNPKAIALILGLRLGSDLVNFAAIVLGFAWTNEASVFAAAGKYLAQLASYRLSDRIFWTTAAKDKARLIELKRFEAAPKRFSTAEAEIGAGKRLKTVFRHINDCEKARLIVKRLKRKVKFLMDLKHSRDD